MIRVVVDTNNLPRNVTSPSAAFKRLVKLIQEGVVGVSMPHVVAEEWRTQQLEQLQKQFQKADNALKGILEGGHLEGHGQMKALTAAAASIDQTKADVEAISQQSLQRLLQQLQTQVIPIAADQGSRVVTSYFKGHPPFSGIKARNDFPDAYVYEAVADVAGPEPGDNLVVVTADKNLSKHLSELPGVSCFETLEQLVESEQVKALTAEIELEAKWQVEFEATVAAVKEMESDALDQGFNNSFVNKVADQEVTHPSIPSDNHDAIVTMVDDPKDMEIDWVEAEDYGPGVLRVPFSCTSEVLLGFFVFYGEALNQPDSISVQWADPEEQPFFDAEAHATANIRGFITVTLNDWPDSIDPQTIEITVDEISEIVLEEDDLGNAV